MKRRNLEMSGVDGQPTDGRHYQVIELGGYIDLAHLEDRVWSKPAKPFCIWRTRAGKRAGGRP